MATAAKPKPVPFEDLIAQQVAEYQGLVQDQQQAAKETSRIGEQTAQSKQVLHLEAAQNARIATEAITQALAELQARRIQYRDAAGGAAKALERIAQINAGVDKTQSLVDEVVRKRNRSIFDLVSDPIGTLKDIVTLDSSEEALKGEVLKVSTLSTSMEHLHKQVTNQITEENDVGPILSAAGAKAKADLAQVEFLVRAQDMRYEEAKYNLLNVEAAAKAKSSIIESMFLPEKAKRDAQQMRNEEARLRLAYAADARAAQESEARKKLMDEQIQGDAADAEFVRRGAATLGINLDATLAKRLAKGANDPRSPYHEYWRVGVRNASAGNGVNLIGASPSEALSVIESTDNRAREIFPRAMEVLNKATEVLNKSKTPIDRKKDPSGWAAAYDKTTQAVANQFLEEITPGSKNPYDVSPHLVKYINNSPETLNTPFVQKFLLPEIKAGTDTANPELIIRKGIAAVVAGQLTTDELIGGVTKVYSSAVAQHAAVSRFRDFGIIPDDAGRSYRVRLDTPGSAFSRTSVVNLTQTTEFADWLKKSMAQEIFRIQFAQKNAEFGKGIGEDINAVRGFLADPTKRYGETIKRGARESYLNPANSPIK